MSAPIDPQENLTSYVMNPEDITEMVRLLEQDRATSRAMGSLLPPSLDLSQTHWILDLACGPGGWTLDVARAYPNIDMIGVDISNRMVLYAQAQAQSIGLDNTSFQVMDILQPFTFPDNSFEFVNARFISTLMSKDQWPPFLQECMRVTTPKGVLRVTDADWRVQTTSPAYERILDLFIRAAWLDGKSLLSDQKRIGTTTMLNKLLHDAGFTSIENSAYFVDLSFGTSAYESWVHNLKMAFSLLPPYLLKMGVTTEEEFGRLREQADLEMSQPTFRGTFFFLSALGQKPENNKSS